MQPPSPLLRKMQEDVYEAQQRLAAALHNFADRKDLHDTTIEIEMYRADVRRREEAYLLQQDRERFPMRA